MVNKDPKAEFLDHILKTTEVDFNGYKVSFRNNSGATLGVKCPPEKRYELYKMFGDPGMDLYWVTFNIELDRIHSIFLYGTKGGRLCDEKEDKIVYEPIVNHIGKVLSGHIANLIDEFKDAVDIAICDECQKILNDVKEKRK